MKLLYCLCALIAIVTLIGANVLSPTVNWPQWNDFKRYYISTDGRVIDPSSPQKITTSEGQSYAMFFALVAKDKTTFDKLFQWTRDNLAAGDLSAQLPAWKWGKNDKQVWGVLDANSAADADLWIAYDLIQAGKLWDKPSYVIEGTRLLNRIFIEEVADIPGLGKMLLPGKRGFVDNNTWLLNPCYLPPQLLSHAAKVNPAWNDIVANSVNFLFNSSPKGFAPNWINWQAEQGFLPTKTTPYIGSYDAIRVYLWIGMLNENDPNKNKLTTHFSPIITITQEKGIPPEEINTATGRFSGNGPLGFSAALLPLMSNSPAIKAQLLRLNQSPMTANAYYDAVLRLFGEGWQQNYFRFSADGNLLIK